MKFERKLTITLDRLVCVVQTQIPLLLTAAWKTSLPGSVVMLLQGSLETLDKAVSRGAHGCIIVNDCD